MEEFQNNFEKNHYRGKATHDNKWYHGNLLFLRKTTYCFKSDYEKDPDNDIYQIVFQQMTDWGLPNKTYCVDVYPNTIGQCTGSEDKCKKRIFEGDIVTVKTRYGLDVGVVVFHQNKFCIYWDSINHYPNCGHIKKYYDINSQTLVVGNIYDNPELIGGNKQ